MIDTSEAKATRIPAGIWALGFVSLLMDVSSEMIHALLPIYLVAVFGAPMAAVGLIEGIAEATASITKIFSGVVSDRFASRKWIAVAGYGLAALTKPVFPLATSLGWVVAARFVDRVGKGIRGAPRDALVADIAPPHLRGASFGLRQTLDTIGAFLGPLAAIVLMEATANSYRTVFWVAVAPAFAAVAILVLAVREPARPKPPAGRPFPLARRELARLGAPFWMVVAVAFVFGLARFSEAFLVLKANDAGLPLALTPLALVAVNIAYALSAYPAGVLSDRVGRGAMLITGLGLLVAADLVLALSDGLSAVGIGVALWGLHMGFTQGVLSTMVADTAPADLRGTGFGVFNLVSGVAVLAASVGAGAAWDLFGPAATFFAGAGAAVLTTLLFLALRRGIAGPAGVPGPEAATR